MAYADVKYAAQYDEERRESNVVTQGNGENPDDFVPYTVKPEWMTEDVWAEYEALQVDEIPFDGSILLMDVEQTSQIADSRDAAGYGIF